MFYKNLKNINKNAVIICMENSKHSQYVARQMYEDYAEVFNLPTFLDKKYFQGFIKYIIETRNVEEIYTVAEYKNLEVLNVAKELKYKENHFKLNYCYSSTNVTNGYGIIRIENVCVNTEIGKIGKSLNEIEK